MSIRVNFWKVMHEYPPVLVRLQAKRIGRGKHVAALSTQEVAIRSGLPLETCRFIQQQPSWDNVSISQAERFCLGCGFDPTNPRHRNRYKAYARQCLSNPTKNWWMYLRNSPWWTTEFVPLVKILRSSKRSSMPQSKPTATPSNFSVLKSAKNSSANA